MSGILQVLRSGCRWRDLDFRKTEHQASGVTHWRRLQFWKNSKVFPQLWSLILKKLKTKHKLNVQILSIDGTFIPSFAFKDTTGYSGQYRKTGVKISNVVEKNGLPLTFRVDSGNKHDLSMAQITLNYLHTPHEWIVKSTLLADKGYDSRAFRLFLHENLLKANIPKTKYSKVNSGYDFLFREETEAEKQTRKNRFVVERTHAWFKSFRRLKFRFDRTKRSFEAFLYLAILVICLRRLM